MKDALILFSICVFLVEFMFIYTPLYVISYRVFSIQEKIADKKLALILVSLTIVFCIIFFPIFYNLIRGIIL